MILLGAAGGDIAGSRFEFNNHRSKDFALFSDKCCFTDDTVMTLAVAQALLTTKSDLEKDSGASREKILKKNTVRCMQAFGNEFPDVGYGERFVLWLQNGNPEPYASFGNGSAMRVSACGWAGDEEDEVLNLAKWVSETTHNHPEGIRGAQATALAVFLARSGRKKDEIRSRMEEFYDLDFTLDGIRDTYQFSAACQQSVPQAFVAFFESESYEDTLRSAVSIGGDSDTIAAIAGSIAEAYFGIPEGVQQTIISYLDEGGKVLPETVRRFNSVFGQP